MSKRENLPNAASAPIAPNDVTPPSGSEQEIADFLILSMDGNFRFVAEWNKWFVYRNGGWLPETTLMAWDFAKYVTRRYCVKVSDQAAKKYTSNSMVNAIVNLARSDRRVVTTIDQWDKDDLLLNTPAGVVDLTNGAIRDGRLADYMMKQTATAPSRQCPIPTWLRFLDEITLGDKQLAGYLQRLAGYALTGLTIEQCLDYFHGGGGNGKSVFIRILAGMMGNYAMTVPPEVFVETKNDRHPTELAQLHNVRLVVASETEGNHYWAEARIKMLTGGDKVRARFMRQDFFEYQPKFKIIIVGNHRPNLRSVTPAIRRRFHLVPFNLELGRDRQDARLEERLKLEYPGILQWAIDGAVLWQLDGGLNPPASVIDETEGYFQRQDTFGEWCEGAIVLGNRAAWTPTAMLYGRYKVAMQMAGETPKSMRAFTDELERCGRGLGVERQTRGKDKVRGFVGVELRAPVVPEGTG